MVSSVTILALPISIIGTNFVEFWNAEESNKSRKEDTVALRNSGKTTMQSLHLFTRNMRFCKDESDRCNQDLIERLQKVASSTPEERREKKAKEANQAKVYEIKALEQSLHVLRTKNLRLLPLQNAQGMNSMATEFAQKLDTGNNNKTPREGRTPRDTLKTQGAELVQQWQADNPVPSILRMLHRSLDNSRWFHLIQEEHANLLKELAALKQVLPSDVDFSGEDKENAESAS